MRERWPGTERVIGAIRTVLRREMGARDAWVIAARGGLRLEARVGDRTTVLLTAPEDEFWARFYKPVTRERWHLGELVTETVTWRKSGGEIAEVLRPLWTAHVGRGGKP